MIVLFQIATILFDAWYQAFHIEENKFNIPHFAAANLVSMFALMVNMLFALYYCQVTWEALLFFLLAGINFIILRTMLFDPAQNLFRRRKWDQRSNPKKRVDVSKIDDLLRPFKNVLLIKSIFLLICLLTIKLIIWLYLIVFTS